uniref:polycomb protein Scm n=1 Tax=Monopterus albus TaxID=43700 RepID=UPI0009B43E7E|nr:polycomb protein Scm-like [Monopterus albus]
MPEPNKYREWILETIDSLRSRKARPDLDRICRMVRRRHGSDPDRTRTELEKLIQEQTVLKVSYKGSISYRNAAKVQRKSRKKSEFTAAGSSSAEAARERTKHDHLNNNGDSAHSFTDQEEGEEDSEPSPDPHSQTSASTTGKKLESASSLSSGNKCLSCGATTGCAVGSGCKEEKASAPKDKGSGQQGVGDCPSTSLEHRTSAHDAGDGSRTASSRADAVRGGKEPGLSGADTQNKTCSGSVSSLGQQQRQNQTAPLKPKLRVGGGGSKTAGNHANSDLGDRLVASVRSLSERSLRGGAAAIPPQALTVSSTLLVISKCLECKTEVGVSSCLLTPTASPRDSGLSEERGINGGVSTGGCVKSEGASGSPVDWTVSDVVSYFTAAGFPEQAAAFRTQEIDGKSLLLMQRNDVLTGLSIRLGPALKIYERHVKVLQKTHFEDEDC